MNVVDTKIAFNNLTFTLPSQVNNYFSQIFPKLAV